MNSSLICCELKATLSASRCCQANASSDVATLRASCLCKKRRRACRCSLSVGWSHGNNVGLRPTSAAKALRGELLETVAADYPVWHLPDRSSFWWWWLVEEKPTTTTTTTTRLFFKVKYRREREMKRNQRRCCSIRWRRLELCEHLDRTIIGAAALSSILFFFFIYLCCCLILYLLLSYSGCHKRRTIST